MNWNRDQLGEMLNGIPDYYNYGLDNTILETYGPKALLNTRSNHGKSDKPKYKGSGSPLGMIAKLNPNFVH